MVAALPISRVVDVQLNLEGILAQQAPIDSCNLIGTSTVIDTNERSRFYSTLTEVATDFGTTAPEYLGAVLWFGQSPQPNELQISRWVNVASSAQLIGASISAANILPSAWSVITAGGFFITIDGVPYAISGLNFGAITNLNGVASVIQTAIQTATSSTQTVVYNAVYNNFVVTDSATGTSSTIGFIAPSTAVGHASFSGQPTANDTLTIDGTVVTFVSGSPTGNQVQIGGTLTITLNNLQTFLNASADTNLVKMTYQVTGSVLYIISVLPGTTGNAYTLAKTSTAITVSGATLAGGVASDISAMTACTSTSGAYLAQGLAAETPLACLVILDNLFAGEFYGVVFVATLTDAQHETIAAYVEGANPPHYYGITSNESGILVPNDTGDLFYILSQLSYNKSAGQYSSMSSYAIVSYLARILTTPWLGSNTTLTLKFKVEPGVAPETLTTTQANAVETKNGNVYVNYQGGVAFIEQGTSFSGQFTDTVIGADWLSGNIQIQVFDALLGALKVPQTDQGMTVILNAVNSACQQGITNGYGAPGQWNTGGFGQLLQGQFLQAGFYTWAPLMETQSQAIRDTRAAPITQVAFKLAGAIHSAEIVLNIEP
jgi:hypothetical protein